MLTKRRSSYSSSTSSSLAKGSSENVQKVEAAQAGSRLGKKRVALGDVTNREIGPQICGKSSISKGILVPCRTKVSSAKKRSSSSVSTTNISRKASLPSPNPSLSLIPPAVTVCNATNSIPLPEVSSVKASPSKSNEGPVSMDESMSTCDSLNSSDFEYKDPSMDESFDRKTFNSLSISENFEPPVTICNVDGTVDMETDDKQVNIDDSIMDPQMCSTFACDIYKHLRVSEAKKRPSCDYMERIQKEINSNMRGILVDWLVEVSEEYKLVPDTLYLTVNYIDRYLSRNTITRQKLQLLGVACMMIAAKYEEISPPHVEDFCLITDNTYFKEEVLQMESAVLKHLKFEMTAPTTKCFLRRFVRAAQRANEVPSPRLEYMANFIAELSLLEYRMLLYAPSLIAASSIFLANYVLAPTERPWNSTLASYTQFHPSELHQCVKALHRLCSSNHSPNLPAVKEKYIQPKYKYVAAKNFPSSIPSEYFQCPQDQFDELLQYSCCR